MIGLPVGDNPHGRWAWLAVLGLTSSFGIGGSEVAMGGDGEAVTPGQAVATNEVVLEPVADTTVSCIRKRKNFGSEHSLDVHEGGRRRFLVAYDQEAIAAVASGGLLRASLRFSITEIIEPRGEGGGSIDLHRMVRAWTESGATWKCARSVNRRCAKEERWNLSRDPEPWIEMATDSAPIPNDRAGDVLFDVTDDVRLFLEGGASNLGWIVKEDGRKKGGYGRGEIRFSSREGGSPPLLELVFEDECADCDPPDLEDLLPDETLHDPATVAPELPQTRVSDVAQAVEFLYAGDDRIQFGVEPGTFEARRVAVVSGRVLGVDGEPVEGVPVTVVGHRAYGITKTRIDGAWDLVVNGGAALTFRMAAEGHLPVDRTVVPRWDDYTSVGEVVVTPLDSDVTFVDFPSSEVQVAVGAVSQDQDGSRAVTLIVSPGTEAALVLPDGSEVPVDGLSIRATELTVGETGPKAMPAELPPQTAYTYAVEFTADEALALGAEEVRFSQPIHAYVDDFIGFPVGSGVPVGYYDRQLRAWLPSDNGRVVSVLGESGGRALLDVTGDGVADGPDELDGMGFDAAELGALATRFPSGGTFWRVPVAHFTPWDCNWPYGPPDDATTPPPQEEPNPDDREDDECEGDGSIIECRSQILRQSLPVIGTGMTLSYSTDRAANRYSRTDFPIGTANIPASATAVRVETSVGGVVETMDLQPQSEGLSVPLVWDGQNKFGSTLQGKQRMRLRIGYVYRPQYQATRYDFARSFGQLRREGVAISGSRSSFEIVVWRDSSEAWVGSLAAGRLGLGSWTLDIHHLYDPRSATIYFGDGTRRSLDEIERFTIGRERSGCDAGACGDGGDAAQARFMSNGPQDVAVGPDGTLWVADQRRLRKITSDRVVSRVAGTGQSPSAGQECGPEGAPASEARFEQIRAVAVHPDGRVLFSDGFCRRIWTVDEEGLLRSFAETGDEIGDPQDIEVAPDGSVYVLNRSRLASGLPQQIWKIEADGSIRHFAGREDFATDNGDGGPAAEALISGGDRIALGSDGSLYLGVERGSIRHIDPYGIIRTIAGDNVRSPVGFGEPAADTHIGAVRGLATDQRNKIYAVVIGDGRVAHLTTIADDGSYQELSTWFPPSFLWTEGWMDIGHHGEVVVADPWVNQLHVIKPVRERQSDDRFTVVSNDGREVFVFSGSGVHLETRSLRTGVAIWRFDYDEAGQLSAVRDRFGAVTRIERTAQGNPTAIVSPDGLRTSLRLDDAGLLATLVDPEMRETSFQYDERGLLTKLVTQRGFDKSYAYDEQMKLIRSSDETGAVQTFERDTGGGITTVTKTTQEGRVTQYRREPNSTGTRTLSVTAPDGTRTFSIARDGQAQTAQRPGGVQVRRTIVPNAEYGLQAPDTTTTTTLGGKTVERSVATEYVKSGAGVVTRVVRRRSVNGRTTLGTFDRPSRTFTLRTPAGRTATTEWDEHGLPKRHQMGNLAPLELDYDARGRLVGMVQGDGDVVRSMDFAYGANGFLTSVTDRMGRTVHYERDAVGRILKQTFPDGREVLFRYDSAGNLVSLAPPGRPEHRLGYNAANLTVSYDPPPLPQLEQAGTTYTYNDDRQIELVTLPGGEVIRMVHSPESGLLQEIVTPLGRYTLSHDSAARLEMLEDPFGGSLHYTYEGHLPLSESLAGEVSGEVSRTWDAEFRLATESVGGEHTVAFGYDPDGLPIAVGALMLRRDPQTSLVVATDLAALSQTIEFNPIGEVEALRYRVDGGALYEAAYTRDELGRIRVKAESIAGETVTACYVRDTAGRLVQVWDAFDGTDCTGTLREEYGYDANSNRTHSMNHTGSVEEDQVVVDDQDRLLRSGDWEYTYTPAGALDSKESSGGAVFDFDYDVMGNLRRVELANGQVVEYVTDALDRRVGKKVDGQLVQGLLYGNRLNPIAELDGAGRIVSRFVYGARSYVPAYMVRDGIEYRLVTDYLGSVVAVVDANTGTIAQRLEYDAWGQVVRDTNPGFQPFAFVGGLWDRDVQLLRLGARDYDPAIGRWTSKDPSGFEGRSPSLYVYAGNDPVNSMDPSGRAEVCRGGLDMNFHVHIFFDETQHWFDPSGADRYANDVGFYPDGFFVPFTEGKVDWNSEYRGNYTECEYAGPDDVILASALDYEDAPLYNVFVHSCSDWAYDVIYDNQSPGYAPFQAWP